MLRRSFAATALLPLMGGEAAIPEATEVVQGLAPIYAEEWTRRFAAKLGLSPEDPEVQPLATRLLDQMAATGADFTAVFQLAVTTSWLMREPRFSSRL